MSSSTNFVCHRCAKGAVGEHKVLLDSGWRVLPGNKQICRSCRKTLSSQGAIPLALINEDTTARITHTNRKTET